jgi:Co/Zn/Cd efflux system component
LCLSIYEEECDPEWRADFTHWSGPRPAACQLVVRTLKSGTRPEQSFTFEECRPDGGSSYHYRSTISLPEPHSFQADVILAPASGRGEPVKWRVEFKEGSAPCEVADGRAKKYERDNNFRAAVTHVLADAFVSVLVIVALGVASAVPAAGFLDPLVAIIGAFVILSWAVQLVRDAGSTLLDVTPDAGLSDALASHLERDGSRVLDLHLWRVGPGHLAACVCVLACDPAHTAAYYQRRLAGVRALSHCTLEVRYRRELENQEKTMKHHHQSPAGRPL